MHVHVLKHIHFPNFSEELLTVDQAKESYNNLIADRNLIYVVHPSLAD